MSATVDLYSLLVGCISIFFATQTRTFVATVATGAALAGLCWYVCSVYTHLWNKRYQLALVHHVFCGVASLLTLLFVVVFAALTHTKDAALISIGLWQGQVSTDAPWARNTFVKAYNSVKELGVEDFSAVAPVEDPDAMIPTNEDQSRQTIATTFANEACRHFDRNRPFLSKIIWSKPQLPSEVVFEDVKLWQQTNPTYPLGRAVELAASQINQSLSPQTPRVVHVMRLSLAVLFVLVQSIPFGLIGWAAYRDIEYRM